MFGWRWRGKSLFGWGIGTFSRRHDGWFFSCFLARLPPKECIFNLKDCWFLDTCNFISIGMLFKDNKHVGKDIRKKGDSLQCDEYQINEWIGERMTYG